MYGWWYSCRYSFNPLSVPSRMNLGQILEVFWLDKFGLEFI
ncbi:hypothetical protein ACA081_00565 [Candidatus Hodgkinia cicadicola]